MTPGDIGASYDKIAKQFQEHRSSTIGFDYVERFISYLPRDPFVLDIGCGTGVPLARQMVASGCTVHGIDISREMLRLARQNVPQASFEYANIVDWSTQNRYDGIIAWDSLFHLNVKHQKMVLPRIFRGLRDDGVALFTVGGMRGEVTSYMFGAKFYYSALSIEEYLEMIAGENCVVLFNERDDHTGHGHVVICVRKT